MCCIHYPTKDRYSFVGSCILITDNDDISAINPITHARPRSLNFAWVPLDLGGGALKYKVKVDSKCALFGSGMQQVSLQL